MGHFVAGNVNLGAVGWLLVGSIPGVLIGTQLTVSIPERVLRIALASVLALSGVKLAEMPHQVILMPAIIGIGLGTMLWLSAARLRKPAAPGPRAEGEVV